LGVFGQLVPANVTHQFWVFFPSLRNAAPQHAGVSAVTLALKLMFYVTKKSQGTKFGSVTHMSRLYR
jgi:hypothetical protein